MQVLIAKSSHVTEMISLLRLFLLLFWFHFGVFGEDDIEQALYIAVEISFRLPYYGSSLLWTQNEILLKLKRDNLLQTHGKYAADLRITYSDGGHHNANNKCVYFVISLIYERGNCCWCCKIHSRCEFFARFLIIATGWAGHVGHVIAIAARIFSPPATVSLNIPQFIDSLLRFDFWNLYWGHFSPLYTTRSSRDKYSVISWIPTK